MSLQTQTTRALILITLIALTAALTASSPTWRIYTHRANTFVPLPFRFASGTEVAPVPSPSALLRRPRSPLCPIPFRSASGAGVGPLPPSWHVRAALQADLTRDGLPECVLLVWRPWEDWPIMKWSDTPSPITANRDARGDSSHIILIEPKPSGDGYRELWAGSALALPITHIAAGDVDGDGWNELVALEGDYASGRYGPARHVAVWRWNGFGFTLEWRGPSGRFVALALADLDRDGAVEILAGER